MALEARTRLRVGRRTYRPGERISAKDEAELRRRPAFGILVEDGDVVEVPDPAPEPELEPEASQEEPQAAPEPTAEPEAYEGETEPAEPSIPVEQVFKALDDMLGPVEIPPVSVKRPGRPKTEKKTKPKKTATRKR